MEYKTICTDIFNFPVNTDVDNTAINYLYVYLRAFAHFVEIHCLLTILFDND